MRRNMFLLKTSFSLSQKDNHAERHNECHNVKVIKNIKWIESSHSAKNIEITITYIDGSKAFFTLRTDEEKEFFYKQLKSFTIKEDND